MSVTSWNPASESRRTTSHFLLLTRLRVPTALQRNVQTHSSISALQHLITLSQISVWSWEICQCLLQLDGRPLPKTPLDLISKLWIDRKRSQARNIFLPWPALFFPIHAATCYHVCLLRTGSCLVGVICPRNWSLVDIILWLMALRSTKTWSCEPSSAHQP